MAGIVVDGRKSVSVTVIFRFEQYSEEKVLDQLEVLCLDLLFSK